MNNKIISKNGTYYFGCSSRYNYKRCNTNSKLFKYLITIYSNPMFTRKQIQGLICPGRKYMYSSYCGFMWRNMLADELILKIRHGKQIYYVLGDKGHKLISNIMMKEFKAFK